MHLSLAGQLIENSTLEQAANRLEKFIAQGSVYLYPFIRKGESKNLSRAHHVITFEVVPKRLMSIREANQIEAVRMSNDTSVFGELTPHRLSIDKEPYFFTQLLDIATCLTLAGSNVYLPTPFENHLYPALINHGYALFAPDQIENTVFSVVLAS